MNFTYELANAEHLSRGLRDEITDALDKRAYICQQEFEKSLEMHDQINVLFEADGEAQVTAIEIDHDSDNTWVTLDCSKVTFL